MAESPLITPYSTALPYITKELPSWVDEYDAQRLASYDLYDDLYENSSATTDLLLRGTDEKPIYVPSSKRLINTLARYVGRGWGFAIDVTTGTGDAQRADAAEAFGTLFARERILTKFNSGKREWLRRGDWIWYISADPSKPEGRRISVRCIDPRLYFPIFDVDEPDRLLGAQLIEPTYVGDKQIQALKIQTWLKPSSPDYPDTFDGESIAYKVEIWDMATWSNPERRKLLSTPQELKEISGIKTLPLYHLQNNQGTGDPFGRSELSGLESLVFGLNQAVSDEDLALAMAGLGMYETDSGAPTNAEGQDGWVLGPQVVVEHATGTKFSRVTGVPSVQPSQDHIKYLEEQFYGTVGLNHIALGAADAQVTESGVALALKMQPLFDASDEKDLAVNDVFNQMFHDLIAWFDQYEGVDLGDVRVYSSISAADRLPFDRSGEFQELFQLFQANAIPLTYLHKELNEHFGYELSSKDLADALEQAKTAAAAADPFGARAAGELSGDQGGTQNGQPPSDS